MSRRAWRGRAGPLAVAERAYARFEERNRLAGRVVHGHADEDHARAEAELSHLVDGKAGEAEVSLAFFAFKTVSFREAIAWNQLAVKVLVNDYFPLLRSDDMEGYGDRVCPLHALDLLIQRDRMKPDGPYSQGDHDQLAAYRRAVREVLLYAVNDLSERKGDLATRLVRGGAAEAFDARYVWEGEPYEAKKPEDVSGVSRLPCRTAKVGDSLRVLANHSGASRPAGATHEQRRAMPDDLITALSVGIDSVYFQTAFDSKHWLALRDLEGVGFKIRVPPDLTKKPSKAPHRPGRPGFNVLGDCVMLERGYAACRANPRHLAEAVALRHLGLMTSQQTKVLLERVWEEWSSRDTFDVVRDLGLLEEVDGDLFSILERVVAENAPAAHDYRSGKKAAFGRIMGGAMKACQGRANPQEVKKLLESLLDRGVGSDAQEA